MPGKKRSEGCRTCVRRRIKCDGTRPQCHRCQKSNLVCDGPASPRPQFLNETSFVIAKHSNAQTLKPGNNSTLLPKQPSPYSEDIFCAFFLASYFTANEVVENDFHANKEWILSAFQSPSSNPISNLALRCLVTGYFGSAHGSNTLQNNARKLYTDTLLRLKAYIANPVTSGDFDVLAAASLLTIYEYTAATSETGWLEHLRGIATLFEMKGPSFFHKHPARALFVFMRTSIVFAAIKWRERCFLERPEWQDFLTTAEDEETLQTIRITNLLTHLSGLVQEALQRQDSLHSSFSSVSDSLTSWYQAWWTEVPSSLPQALPVSSPELSNITSKTLWYTRLDVAASFVQYHAAIILLQKWVLPFVTQDSAIEEHQATIQKHALSICQSIPYLLVGEHSHLGAFYLLFPVYVASQALQPGQAERQWLESVLTHVARDKGIAIAQSLADKLA